MSGSSDQGKQRTGGSGRPGDSWERRAADLANEVQRWLIRSSARNMRDELSGQVKKAFRGADNGDGDVWSRATTEPPDAADQPPECTWCPICRAARRMAQSQGGYSGSGVAMSPGDAAPKGTAGLAGAADVLFGAARDALVGLDAILSYRPGDASSSSRAGESPAQADGSADSDRSGDDQAGPGHAHPAARTQTATDPDSERDDEPDHRS